MQKPLSCMNEMLDSTPLSQVYSLLAISKENYFTYCPLGVSLARSILSREAKKGGKMMSPQRVVLLVNLTQTLARFHILLQPSDALIIIEQMIAFIESKLEEMLEIETMTGLLFHLACSQIPERQKSTPLSNVACRSIERRFQRELHLCLQAIRESNQQLAHPIPDEEAYNILGILKHVDIFIEVEDYPLASR